MLFSCLLDFFINQHCRKIISQIPSEWQTDWILIRPDVLLHLVWVQSVCKGYQQTTLGGNELSGGLVSCNYNSNTPHAHFNTVKPLNSNSNFTFSKYSLIWNKFGTHWIQNRICSWNILITVNNNICFGCVKETSPWDVSSTHPKLMFDREKNDYHFWGLLTIIWTTDNSK